MHFYLFEHCVEVRDTHIRRHASLRAPVAQSAPPSPKSDTLAPGGARDFGRFRFSPCLATRLRWCATLPSWRLCFRRAHRSHRRKPVTVNWEILAEHRKQIPTKPLGSKKYAETRKVPAIQQRWGCAPRHLYYQIGFIGRLLSPLPAQHLRRVNPPATHGPRIS